MSFIDDFRKRYTAEDMDVHSGLLSAHITLPGMHEKAELKFDLIFKTAVISGQGYDVLFDMDGVIDVNGSFRGKQEFGSAAARDGTEKGDLKWAEWSAYDAMLSTLYRRTFPLAVEMTWEQRDAANRMNEAKILDAVKTHTKEAGWNNVEIIDDRKGYTLRFSAPSVTDIRETYDNLYDLVMHLKGDLIHEIEYAEEKDRPMRKSLAVRMDLSPYEVKLPETTRTAEKIRTKER